MASIDNGTGLRHVALREAWVTVVGLQPQLHRVYDNSSNYASAASTTAIDHVLNDNHDEMDYRMAASDVRCLPTNY
jgi:hypothetical protein